MAKNKLTKQQQQTWAREEYRRGELTQKEIALKVGISEKTIGLWVQKYNWDKERKSLLTTKDEILRDLYDTLDAMKAEAKKFAKDDDPATKPDSDGIYKMTLAIKKLEGQTGVGEMIHAFKLLVKAIQAHDLELAKTVTHWADIVIQDKLKES